MGLVKNQFVFGLLTPTHWLKQFQVLLWKGIILNFLLTLDVLNSNHSNLVEPFEVDLVPVFCRKSLNFTNNL